jgi:hypothetical protein
MLPVKEKPLVTVGPVICSDHSFTIEKFDSLLPEDCANLEIIIRDDCSTDGSAQNCKADTESDKRIRYKRHQKNGDSPEDSSGAATAYGTSTWIEVAEIELKKNSGWHITGGIYPILRFIFAFWGYRHMILGVDRARYLQASPRNFTCTGADQVLLTDQALRGAFIRVRDRSWCRRRLRTEESYAEKLMRYEGGDFGMTGSWTDRKLQLLRLPVAQARCILRSDLSWIRGIVALGALFPAFLVRRLAGHQ